MATEVILPRLGQGMESGTIVRWLKSEGEPVEKGEPLFELDTDKVTQEVEAEAAGVLLKIAIAEGEVPVGQTVAFIGSAGEDVPEVAAAAPVEEPEKSEPAEPAREAEEPRHEVASGNGRIKASPLARRIARERGIELSGIRGTGPDGRIVAEDVERAEAGGPATPAVAPRPVPSGEVERVPLTNIRKTIARRLTEAWQIPVFQLQASADMTRVNALVARLRERDPDVRVTVTDVLTKVCAQALMRHREVNAEFTEDAILLHPSANVGLAVAAPQGLVVPVIRQRRAALAHGDRRRASRSRRPGARQQAACRGSRRRHVHDLQPRHVRSGALHSRAEPAASCDRGRRRDRGTRRPASKARRPCGRWSPSLGPSITAPSTAPRPRLSSRL